MYSVRIPYMHIYIYGISRRIIPMHEPYYVVYYTTLEPENVATANKNYVV